MMAKVHFFLKARTSDFVLSWTCQLSHISSSNAPPSPSSPTSKPAKDLKYPMHTLHARLASATSAKRKYWSIFKKGAINTNPQQKYTFAKISGVGCSPIVKSDLRWHDLPRNLHPQQVLFQPCANLLWHHPWFFDTSSFYFYKLGVTCDAANSVNFSHQGVYIVNFLSSGTSRTRPCYTWWPCRWKCRWLKCQTLSHINLWSMIYD